MNVLVATLIVAASVTTNDVGEALGKLISAQPDAAPRLIEKIVEADPGADAILAAFEDGIAPRPEEARRAKIVAGWSAWTATDTAGVSRPYQLYVPRAIAEGARPKALLVHLHGAVGRSDYGTGLGTPNTTGYASLLWPDLAEREGIVVATPLGRADCMWWTDPGVRHVRAVVRDVRRGLAIPERSVFASGFSDGASGCYYLAMTGPDPFAGFLAMNGHPAVAASSPGKQLYLRNLAASSIIAATTQEDSLYPSRTVLPHLQIAIGFGASVHVLSYPSMNHQPSYFKEQQSLITRFLSSNEPSAPSRLVWLTSDVELGRARWLEILELGKTASDRDALTPSNVPSEPGRVRLGVSLDGATSTLASIREGSLASSLGLRVGDEVQQINADRITSSTELRQALRSLTYGGHIALAVRRDGERIVVQGTVPDFTPEPIYQRERDTAHVDITIQHDGSGEKAPPIVKVDTHGVRRLRVWLPNVARLHDEAFVTINGKNRDVPIRTRSTVELLRALHEHGHTDAARICYLEIEVPSTPTEAR